MLRCRVVYSGNFDTLKDILIICNIVSPLLADELTRDVLYNGKNMTLTTEQKDSLLRHGVGVYVLKEKK